MNEIAYIWQLAALPEDALSRLTLTGEQTRLPSSFQVGKAAQTTIACAALAATEVAKERGAEPGTCLVDLNAAEAECTGYFTLDGKVPQAWAPLSGLYPCKDGWVRIHANFDHHRDGALEVLGITDPPDQVDKERVIEALARWGAIDFETAAADAGMVVSAARSFDEWDAHPQSRAVAELPLLTIEKIGEAPPREHGPLEASDKPLHDIRVLDLTRILAGPVGGRALAAYGADVMLVNSPHLPNIEAIADTSRGKLSVHLDLRDASDRENMDALLKDTHVFMQGYRPGGLQDLGFAPEELATRRPGIVCVSLSAYSHVGPWSTRRGFDSLVQTATGFNRAEANAFGTDTPKAMPVQILDYASGFLMAFGAQAALARQIVEGGSWHVRVSLVQTATWLRSLGRNFEAINAEPFDRSALQDLTRRYDSGFGELSAIPHGATFSNFTADFKRPSVPPGSNVASWRPGST